MILVGKPGISQYVLNGSASSISCNCYTITPAVNWQSGSVWNGTKINLNNPFDFWFNVFLGCADGGADGIVFMLQPLSTNVGTNGEGMGFSGVSPSIGIALDTYANSNLNDPLYDHISIQANGNINHSGDLAGPVRISSITDNVEDCQWHRLRISWDPATKWLRSYFDGVLRVEKQLDLISAIFNNDPMVYWGFSGATGGQMNLQQFCTALDPDFTTNLTNDIGCAGTTVQFTNQSQSFAPVAGYSWNFGDGDTSTAMIPPLHQYVQAGSYEVNLKIKGLDGCENDTSKTIMIASAPVASLQVSDTCFTYEPRVNFSANNFGVGYEWLLDGNIISTSQNPVLSNLTAGMHDLSLILSSSYNCGLPDTAQASFFIRPKPLIDFNFSQVCRTISFNASQSDNQTSIDQWNWLFGDGNGSVIQSPVHAYANQGQYMAKLWAIASNGCRSDTVKHQIDIPSVLAFAGNDTTVISNMPFQLHATGNGSFSWWPSTGLSDASISDPIATVPDRQTYILTVNTPEGCVTGDTINIIAYKGPNIFVPNAFTPNGDGLNDILRPVYVGISKLDRFEIYNRWGQRVFTTSDMSNGWGGRIGNQPAAPGSFVWIIKATNYLDKPVIFKGTVTIIR